MASESYRLLESLYLQKLVEVWMEVLGDIKAANRISRLLLRICVDE